VVEVGTSAAGGAVGEDVDGVAVLDVLAESVGDLVAVGWGAVGGVDDGLDADLAGVAEEAAGLADGDGSDSFHPGDAGLGVGGGVEGLGAEVEVEDGGRLEP
jgi:hypothetical protein